MKDRALSNPATETRFKTATLVIVFVANFLAKQRAQISPFSSRLLRLLRKMDPNQLVQSAADRLIEELAQMHVNTIG